MAASARRVDSFARRGTLPDDHILYGPAKPVHEADEVKRATSTTSASADSTCTNSATSRNCWANGYSVADDFDSKWPTTGVTRYVRRSFLKCSTLSEILLTALSVYLDNHQFYM